jgi:superfamily I DNA/RNA helicase
VSRRIIKQLTKRLANKGRMVQAYMSGVDEHSTLDWSLPGVYILMYPSTKGLQFDHVCIPRLETADGAVDQDLARMRFYVMATRARSGLTVSWNGRKGSSPPAVASLFDRSLMEVDE